MKITNLFLSLLISVSLSACSLQRHKPETEAPPTLPTEAAKTEPENPAPPSPAPVVAEVQAAQIPLPEPTHTPASEPPKSHHSETPSVPAEKALGWLKNGNTRFLTNRLRKDGQSQADVTRLAKGQHPHAVVLSCSDSRVPPEIVFDQKLGEIFVVRTAGEDPDASAIASIEYAVEHLGPELILVMGHTSCGAVKAAIEVGEKDAGSLSLNSLVHNIQPRLGSYQSRTPSEKFQEESWMEAKGVAADLMNKSEIIKKRIQAGQLKIVTALYHTENGKVDFSD